MFPEFFTAELDHAAPSLRGTKTFGLAFPWAQHLLSEWVRRQCGHGTEAASWDWARNRGANLTLHLLGSQEIVVTSGNLGIRIWALVLIIYINMK